MNQEQLKIVRGSEISDFNAWVWEFNRKNWPEFMFKDPVAAACWLALEQQFSDYQFALTDKSTSAIVAQVNSLPLAWDSPLDELPETGWDWALQQGVSDRKSGKPSMIQCALQIAIGPEYRGQGISAYALQVMKQIGREKGLTCLVAPVRPNRKADYPAMPIVEYVRWTIEDGLPFDPWLRVHVRAGGEIIKVCRQSLTISGSVREWEEWSGMSFPVSGSYEVPGALTPVTIDREIDSGLYIEPNVWVRHSLR